MSLLQRRPNASRPERGNAESQGSLLVPWTGSREQDWTVCIIAKNAGRDHRHWSASSVSKNGADSREAPPTSTSGPPRSYVHGEFKPPLSWIPLCNSGADAILAKDSV